METYFHEHSGVSFSHSYCPTCYDRFVKPQLDALEDVTQAQRKQKGR